MEELKKLKAELNTFKLYIEALKKYYIYDDIFISGEVGIDAEEQKEIDKYIKLLKKIENKIAAVEKEKAEERC